MLCRYIGPATPTPSSASLSKSTSNLSAKNMLDPSAKATMIDPGPCARQSISSTTDYFCPVQSVSERKWLRETILGLCHEEAQKRPSSSIDTLDEVIRDVPPPEIETPGMPWIKGVPPTEVKAVVEELISDAEVWVVPDLDPKVENGNGPESDLEKSLRWAAGKRRKSDEEGVEETNLVVLAGSLYLVADFHRFFGSV
ncbi:hypothetical protein BYT27DRAFT_7215140 [Phlegmacium glaucopus]|nr:hypothetical protein BYT27DRAFT_7215140 [Phlegmacium glaucopus]